MLPGPEAPGNWYPETETERERGSQFLLKTTFFAETNSHPPKKTFCCYSLLTSFLPYKPNNKVFFGESSSRDICFSFLFISSPCAYVLTDIRELWDERKKIDSLWSLRKLFYFYWWLAKIWLSSISSLVPPVFDRIVIGIQVCNYCRTVLKLHFFLIFPRDQNFENSFIFGRFLIASTSDH